MGCSRPRQRADGGVCHSSVRQRTTANEPANNGPRFPPPLLADQRHTPNDTHTQAHPRWRPGGSAPQTPRDLSPLCQARREKQKRDAFRASRLRSWPLSRRSGRVSASPCPPLRSLTILSALQPQNHSWCAPAPLTNAARFRQPTHSGERPGGPNPLHRGHPRSRTDSSALVRRDPRRSFFQTRLKFPVPPHFGSNQAPRGR
jgi:hypothetical protein